MDTGGNHEARCPYYQDPNEPIILSWVKCDCHKRIAELEQMLADCESDHRQQVDRAVELHKEVEDAQKCIAELEQEVERLLYVQLTTNRPL